MCKIPISVSIPIQNFHYSKPGSKKREFSAKLDVFEERWQPCWKEMVAMITYHVNLNLMFDWVIVCFGLCYQIW